MLNVFVPHRWNNNDYSEISALLDRTKYKVRLKNIMDLIFPEFFSFFSDSYGPTPMYLLT